MLSHLASVSLFYLSVRSFYVDAISKITRAPFIQGGGGNNIETSNNIHKQHESLDLRPTILILDVDNTLYDESQCHIEHQIIQNTYQFCKKYFNFTQSYCDELYIHYGSTVEGLRQWLLDGNSEGKTDSYDRLGNVTNILSSYYKEVYDNVDISSLLEAPIGDTESSGYSCGGYQRKGYIAQLLRSINVPIYLASNSPKHHVMKILTALQLRNIPFEDILTPDSPDVHQADMCTMETCFPTKNAPHLFYKTLLERHPADQNNIFTLDDSRFNIEKAAACGIKGYRISHSRTKDSGCHSLEDAIGEIMGYILPRRDKHDGDDVSDQRRDNGFTFSDEKYLRSKNIVDFDSINLDVWFRLRRELASLSLGEDGTLRIADIGAGLLPMLRLVLQHNCISNRGNVGQGEIPCLIDDIPNIKSLVYYAYESNINLMRGCYEELERLGFVPGNPQELSRSRASTVSKQPHRNNHEEHSFRRQSTNSCPEVIVHLMPTSFAKDTLAKLPHLVIGCCFADLYQPSALVNMFMMWLNRISDNKGVPTKILFYFPLTFSGTTCFHPPSPFSEDQIPSDTLSFQLYSKGLVERHGHSVDPESLICSVGAIGGELLIKGSSNWVIDPELHTYFWECMMYFFGSSAALELSSRRWNASGWVRRARYLRPSIHVTNTDLLFSIPSKFGQDLERAKSVLEEPQSTTYVKEIQFYAPHKVRIVSKDISDSVNQHLGPYQIEVKSICSLISSGTELKIFQGLFDDAPLDVNIKGLTDVPMAYPLAYGYSLVGRVTRCGESVEDAEDIIGKLVFTFSPHSSRVIVDRDRVHLVPDGISAKDAMFMPSVETAVSIVHDAHVRIGERIAIFGQGLIGLLVTAVLCGCHSGIGMGQNQHCRISSFDTVIDRLAASSALGSSEALLPRDAKIAGPFDVAIEVSGQGCGLQSAIDNTPKGGRIIIASWYGKGDVNLKLGIDFHRSRKTIVTSQVSEIPPDLRCLWTKKRRFNLTWELVRMIRPSKILTETVHLERAQEAYERLHCGKDIAISFSYDDL